MKAIIFLYLFVLLVVAGVSHRAYLHGKSCDARAFTKVYISCCCYIITILAATLIDEKPIRKLLVISAFVISMALLIFDQIKYRRHRRVIEFYKSHKSFLTSFASVFTLCLAVWYIHPSVSSMVSQLTGVSSAYFQEVSVIISISLVALVWFYLSPLILLTVLMVDPGGDKEEEATLACSAIGLSLVYGFLIATSPQTVSVFAEYFFKNHFIEKSFYKNERILLNSTGVQKICKNLKADDMINIIDSGRAVIASRESMTFIVATCDRIDR